MKKVEKLWAVLGMAFVVLTSGVAVSAKPMVSLVLSGVVVTKDDKGQEQTMPLGGAAAPGVRIRYSILVSNKGDQDARNVIPVGNIPGGTAYEAGSASQKDAQRVEFSLDHGKTWSAHPTITVHTSTGDVVKAADPATYTTVRWIVNKPLQPKAAVSYTYDVHVK